MTPVRQERSFADERRMAAFDRGCVKTPRQNFKRSRRQQIFTIFFLRISLRADSLLSALYENSTEFSHSLDPKRSFGIKAVIKKSTQAV